MSALKKPILALVGVVAMLLTGLFFATSSAGAYPPGTAADAERQRHQPDLR